MVNARQKYLANFGARTRKARESISLSQEELAKLVDTSKSMISSYESGANDPRPAIVLDIVARLAQELKVGMIESYPGILDRVRRDLLDMVHDITRHPTAVLAHAAINHDPGLDKRSPALLPGPGPVEGSCVIFSHAVLLAYKKTTDRPPSCGQSILRCPLGTYSPCRITRVDRAI